ncbi:MULTISPECIES: carboxylating nicotinate-nucleotide diphosphorylase [Helicobacter]|uniref:nicotinate-nucleotide diphosphorylase (carboxylating) n=1 Tax=Helicobacter ibis TaxID=2962633 RepID=A0ABT4VDH4_9HELI|nr:MULTISPECIES: carboxylating nicotinate-nucleotide diphosphorylase [Helicobacter]MDA3967843.1 carboxylating nicotinate-nucleotide diphosphorylase [Helicobacter sp. WB40]MDA3968745.1 carboxylating nicotinate-nucleotide diphosphorylase [Helicobacter ibis]
MLKILLDDFLKQALLEDNGRGDLYYLLSDKKIVKTRVIAKDSGILSGEIYITRLCELVGVDCEFLIHDSNEFKSGDIILNISGLDRDILSIERVLLNILQHSSGIATNANKYAKKLQNTKCKILDTRKTRPLLREFEKYSSKQGGIVNHRLGLDDCLMLKDTHMANISNLKEFVEKAKSKIPWTSKIEVECEDIRFFKEALSSGVDIIMCDNMQIDDIIKCVRLRNDIAPHVLIEASGNITLDNILEYANSGIDAISSGSIIHQARWIDLSMKFIDER